jgi:predicted 3-demethylubiquinone-9 3-methyltransferase (glyoxalase superfamily)
MKNPEVRTFLWFQTGLADALNFYKSTFKEFKVYEENHMDGHLFTCDFEIHGHRFIGMDTPGGEKFNNAVSISVQVSGQAEVDRLWDAITKEGEEIACGWAKDKWGVHWQITPFEMRDWLGHKDPEVAQFAWQAMMKMKKIIISELHK